MAKTTPPPREPSRLRLTKRAIDAATYHGADRSPCFLWDTDCPGLGLRIQPSGRKSFVLDYRIAGRRRRLTLGAYGLLTLDGARELAREQAASIARGRDPADQAAKGISFRAFSEEYWVHHGSKKRSGSEDRRRLDKVLLPRWGDLPLAALGKGEVLALHRSLGEHPYEANRILALVSVLWGKAQEWERIDAGLSNPARGVRPYPEAPRRRFLTAEEWTRLRGALDALEDPYVQAAVWLYLLTGLRRGELLPRRWDEVDLKRGFLTVPRTKGGGPALVPLTPLAVELLRALPRRPGNRHVFPGRNQGEPLKSFRKTWRSLLRSADLEDLRLHDLRRTVGSWLAQDGASLQLIGKVLRHRDTGTTAQHYAHLTTAVVRRALEEQERRLRGPEEESEKE